MGLPLAAILMLMLLYGILFAAVIYFILANEYGRKLVIWLCYGVWWLFSQTVLKNNKPDKELIEAKVNAIGNYLNRAAVPKQDDTGKISSADSHRSFVFYYIITIAIEFLASGLRFILIVLLVLPIVFLWKYFTSQIPFYLLGEGTIDALVYFLQWLGNTINSAFAIAFWLSISNILWSIWAYNGLSSGGFFTRWALGARESSRREKAVYFQASGDLLLTVPAGTLGHDSWWMIDSIFPNTYTIGKTLYITTGALQDDHFKALLAHEIGHRNHGDGSYLKALRNFIYPFMQYAMTSVRSLRSGTLKRDEIERATNDRGLLYNMTEQTAVIFFSLFFGGLGVLLLAPVYAKWFRSRDYYADEFVGTCELAPMLLEHLEETKQFDSAVPFWNLWTPYTELRIDRLLMLVGQ